MPQFDSRSVVVRGPFGYNHNLAKPNLIELNDNKVYDRLSIIFRNGLEIGLRSLCYSYQVLDGSPINRKIEERGYTDNIPWSIMKGVVFDSTSASMLSSEGSHRVGLPKLENIISVLRREFPTMRISFAISEIKLEI